MSSTSTSTSTALSNLTAKGQPVHTRAVEVEVFRSAPGRVRVQGTILDLRKHGFIPTGGRLQTSGVIHHMGIDAEVDVETRVIEHLETSQPVVAFEPSPMTGGESCRDIGVRLEQVVGLPLDAGFARQLSSRFGGPLGCSHLLTLAQSIGSAVPRALDWEEKYVGDESAERREGESLFKRGLLLDGLEMDEAPALDVVVQLNDVHSLPATRVANPLDRFLRQHEVRILARVDLEKLCFVSLRGDERERGPGNLASAGWNDLDPTLSSFAGHAALRGLAGAVMQKFGVGFPPPPLRDALLFIAPGIIQCLAVNAQRMVETRAESTDGASIQHLGGMPDSCYIWRDGGPAQRSRQGAPRPPLREGARKDS